LGVVLVILVVLGVILVVLGVVLVIIVAVRFGSGGTVLGSLPGLVRQSTNSWEE